jgi:CRISPR system Cascade subunit CasC
MTTKRLFLDIHAIQTIPPANINRDDTGTPKTAQYGGVTRSRVSSQSWKKAIRKYFNENGAESNVGIRSLEVVRYLADKIKERDPSVGDEEALKLANNTFNKAGISTKDNKVRALFFIGSAQAENLALASLEGISDKKALQAILNDNPSIDIALFGRMVADDPTLNEDASSQVAHSISTHAIQTEFDFFTATDDLAPEDSAGAGMLGTVEFNSSTLYRYANVAIHELMHQLSGNADATVAAISLFIEAFVKSMPTGKINTFANQTLPQAVLVTLREDRPVNLISAFESPVKSSEGYVDKSIARLKQEFDNVSKFTQPPLVTHTIGIFGLGEEKEDLQHLLSELRENTLALIK